jgi:hypothetical protein
MNAMKDNQPTESVSRLEAVFGNLRRISARHFTESNARIGAVTDRANELTSRAGRLDWIEPMLIEAYAETHPPAERDLLAIERATDWDFINLPSIQNLRRRS